ncbi:MAG TPA: hypothetical protein VNQ80_09370 [Parapedobacter sp.]|uniref:phenylacetate--CoA ligase family protein n=1 Tax=Parapedobacter sp. TaxID=1958893 RepID=UPI002BB7E3FC|nr:hypothetical protein [Parapedobacter sp.]HWK57536.1 hypothetical protein [Parapedobacter sp.]
MNKLEIYKRLPIFLQNLACSYEGFKLAKSRMGGGFPTFLTEYLERNKWPFERLIEYQSLRLQRMVNHCVETVPYYNRVFKKTGIIPSDIKTAEDLKILPILTKEEVRQNPSEFISSKYKIDRLVKIQTSGSTGSSLVLYYTIDQLQEQFALWWKYRICIGIPLDMWCADFGSRTIVPIEQTDSPFWRVSSPLRQVKFSAFHINEKNAIEYFNEIKKRKLTWIHGYPSIVTAFAASLIANNLSLDGHIKYVTVGGENIYDFQRNMMYKAFGVRPYSHYGLAECVANFSENSNHELIVDEDFSVVEFVESNGTYRIVGTNLANLSMPLLRYDTNDIATIDTCCSKTGYRKVLHVDGRNGEYVLLKSGGKVGSLSALFTETDSIIEAQIHQKKDYSLDIRYVSNSSYEHISKDLEGVREKLRERLGDDIIFNFIKVEKIERTQRGKLRYVVSDFENYKEISMGGN